MKGLALLLLPLLPSPGLLQDSKQNAEKAIANMRAQKSYSTKFKAVTEIPNSDKRIIEGRSLWVNPDILYIHYTGSGGDEKRIVRVGDKVWVYHEFVEDWVTSEDMGDPGAGRGVQNPDEVLSVLSRHLANAKDGGKEKVGSRECSITDLGLTGSDIEKIMKEQASQGSFDWKNSKVEIKLWLADNLVQKFSSVASLLSTEESLRGKTVKYTAEVEVTSFGTETTMKFSRVDEKTKKVVDIPVPEPILKAIQEQLKKKP